MENLFVRVLLPVLGIMTMIALLFLAYVLADSAKDCNQPAQKYELIVVFYNGDSDTINCHSSSHPFLDKDGCVIIDEQKCSDGYRIEFCGVQAMQWTKK